MNEIIGEVSEDVARGLLGPARYGEYTMARMQAEIQVGRPVQTEGSSEGLVTGTILLLAVVLAFFLLSWFYAGHPGTFLAWLWHDLLDSIAN